MIESVSVHGPSATIKSHHNVGGLPAHLHLELVEPLRFLFKDEVRKVGRELGIPANLIDRHPFPGPGLAIRILGEITEEKVSLLQRADHIYTQRYAIADSMQKSGKQEPSCFPSKAWVSWAMNEPTNSPLHSAQ